MEMIKSAQRERFEEETFPHLKSLWRTAQWLTMRRSRAEALLLKTITQAYRTWYDSRETVGTKARLFRILNNELLECNTDNHQPHWLHLEPIKSGPLDTESDTPQPASSIARTDLLQLAGVSHVSVKQVASRLRVQSRLILILALRERFSYAEIAYITGLSNDSIRSILSQARRLIPRYLVQHTVWFTAAGEGRLPNRWPRA